MYYYIETTQSNLHRIKKQNNNITKTHYQIAFHKSFGTKCFSYNTLDNTNINQNIYIDAIKVHVWRMQHKTRTGAVCRGIQYKNLDKYTMLCLRKNYKSYQTLIEF